VFLEPLALVAGLMLLIGGGEGLVRGAGALARQLGVPQLVVGLTVVAFGTSAPELAVNVTAAWRGSTDVAFGNVVGSNLANIGLVLAVCGLLRPLAVQGIVVSREIPMMLLATAAACVLALDRLGGRAPELFDRSDGLMLLLLFGVFLYYTAADVLRQRSADPFVQQAGGVAPLDRLRSAAPSALVTGGGLVLLVLGGQLTVWGAIGVAEALGVPRSVIGLTLVALGTSLPELATGIVAVRRGHTDLAMGSVVGSNIFNLLFILGVTSTLHPVELPAGGAMDLLVLRRTHPSGSLSSSPLQPQPRRLRPAAVAEPAQRPPAGRFDRAAVGGRRKGLSTPYPLHTTELRRKPRMRKGNPHLGSRARGARALARTHAAIGVTLLIPLLLAWPAVAQEAEVAERPPAPAVPDDELGRGSPRGAVQGYLAACREGDYETAARFLDLRRIQDDGSKLARQLRIALSRTLWIDVEGLSQHPDGHRNDGLPAYRDRVGTIETRRGAVDILLQRVPREDGVHVWQFAGVTVAQVPVLWGEFGYGVLERFLPQVFFEFQLLDLALWQWIALLVLVLVSAIVSWLLTVAIVWVLGPFVRRTDTPIDDAMVEGAAGPIRLVAAVLISRAALVPLGLDLEVLDFISRLLSALFVVAATWLLFRVIDVLSERIEQRLVERGQGTATAAVPPGRKAIKGIIFVLAFVAILDGFGFSVTALIAGLGVGGIAVALAAQKTIENLFGGLTLYGDRPVRVGDFCRFGDKIGTVEEIGIRSTRVRTLDRTLVTIPNAEFSSLQLENYAERDRMRLFAMIGVRYETTPDQLRYILVEVRKLLYSHERVTADPARIRFVGFGAYSLDLELFAYVNTSDWSEFLGIREDIYLRIMDIIEASGTGFAFPSQTLYLGKDDAPAAERAREVADEVRGWRERKELFLPSFPPERIAAIENTLAYPAEGSPDHRASS
jgi:MscS family membrane protein